jgi:hypothetical protein
MVEKMKIVPVVVAEQVVRKTFKGEEVTYLVSHKENDDPIDLTRLKGDVYQNLEEVRTLLIDNVTRNIDTMCSKVDSRSKELSHNLFGDSPSTAHEAQPEIKPEAPEENVFVLEDGTKARVHF